MVHHGYFLLADISGYTRFLDTTELAHAQGILQELLEAMIADLQLPLTLSSVRGDAIVAHAPGPNLPDGEHLIEAVERLYLAFRGALTRMEHNTTCPCAACSAIGGLDLKMIVHHGEYVVQTLAGRPELHGADVVAAFRLLKNDIIEATGIEAYVGYTAAAVEALDVPAWFETQARHRQATEEFGEIEMRVADMHALWTAHRERNQIRVEGDQPRFFEDIEVVIPAERALVWTLFCDTGVRAAWFPDVLTAQNDTARRGIGETVHCAHGSGPPTIYTTVDQSPFEYTTFDVRLPMGGTLRATVSLADVEGGTRAHLAIAKADAPGPIRRGLLRLMTGMMAKKQRATWAASFEALSELATRTRAEHTPVEAIAPSADDLRASIHTALSA